MIFVRGAPTLVAALTSGDMDIGYTGGTAVLGASPAGIDLKILAVLTNRVTYDLVARPGIKSAEDLRGKRFGVTSIGGTLWMGAVLGLEKLGLDIDRDDIKVLVIGDQVVLSQALEDNRIDATVLDTVFSKRLAQKGFSILAELHKTNLPITATSLVARQSYVQKESAADGKLYQGGDGGHRLRARSGEQGGDHQTPATALACQRTGGGRGIRRHAHRHGQEAVSVHRTDCAISSG